MDVQFLSAVSDHHSLLVTPLTLRWEAIMVLADPLQSPGMPRLETPLVGQPIEVGAKRLQDFAIVALLGVSAVSHSSG